MKLTPWYPGTIKPVRVGVYERRYPDGATLYSLWDGVQWYWAWDTAALASREYKYTYTQTIPWRGVAK